MNLLNGLVEDAPSVEDISGMIKRFSHREAFMNSRSRILSLNRKRPLFQHREKDNEEMPEYEEYIEDTDYESEENEQQQDEEDEDDLVPVGGRADLWNWKVLILW